MLRDETGEIKEKIHWEEEHQKVVHDLDSDVINIKSLVASDSLIDF